MAITITPEIFRQQATDNYTYCYLYEPLRVKVTESNGSATKIYIDILLQHTEDTLLGTTTFADYAEYDLDSSLSISVDLMELAKQVSDANVYKKALANDFHSSTDAYHSVVSKWKFLFRFRSDTGGQEDVRKLPIVGGRMFRDFAPTINTAVALTTEFEKFGLDYDEMRSKWSDVFTIKTTLVDPTLQNASPTLDYDLSPAPDETCKIPKGFLIWKSIFGGWMFWGFDIQTQNFNGSYEGQLEVGNFESTLEENGEPYIPVDYTAVNLSYSRKLKALALTPDELKAVAGIASSPAIYYLEPNTDNANPSHKVELMRLTSSDAPISTNNRGGDFTVSLNSISKIGQKTI